MKFPRNLRSRKLRNFGLNGHESNRRVDKWPAWKKNALLVRHISLLK